MSGVEFVRSRKLVADVSPCSVDGCDRLYVATLTLPTRRIYFCDAHRDLRDQIMTNLGGKPWT